MRCLLKIFPFITFISLFIFALFFWTFAEYILHRFLFHWITENKYVKRFHFIVHGSHHLYPRDKERILMPPVPGLIMASILFGIFYVVFSLLGLAVLYLGVFFRVFSGLPLIFLFA
jgi:sterol desaturase/sphingolipid hydroxylase (fatty acid hydroxylase superfamily)